MHLHRSGRSLVSIVQAAVRWAPLQTPIAEPLCHAQVSLSSITILLPRIRLTCPLVAPQNHPHRPLECVCPAHCRPPPPSLSNKLTSPLLPLRPISQNSLPHPTPPVTLRPTTRVSLSPSRSSCPSPACTRAMSDRPRLLTEQRASTGVRNQSSPQLSFPSLFSWEEEGELEIDFSPSRVFVADETLSSRLLLRVRELRRPPEVHRLRRTHEVCPLLLLLLLGSLRSSEDGWTDTLLGYLALQHCHQRPSAGDGRLARVRL